MIRVTIRRKKVGTYLADEEISLNSACFGSRLMGALLVVPADTLVGLNKVGTYLADEEISLNSACSGSGVMGALLAVPTQTTSGFSNSVALFCSVGQLPDIQT